MQVLTGDTDCRSPPVAESFLEPPVRGLGYGAKRIEPVPVLVTLVNGPKVLGPVQAASPILCCRVVFHLRQAGLAKLGRTLGSSGMVRSTYQRYAPDRFCRKYDWLRSH